MHTPISNLVGFARSAKVARDAMEDAAIAEARRLQACQYYLKLWSERAVWTPSERAQLLHIVRRDDGTLALQDFLAKVRLPVCTPKSSHH
jgi:hypothetical protein